MNLRYKMSKNVLNNCNFVLRNVFKDTNEYRVATDKWNNVWFNCDLILSPADFLSLLEAHQIQSIW